MSIFHETEFPPGLTESPQRMRSALLLYVGGTDAPVKLVLSSEVDAPLEVHHARIPAGTNVALHLTPAAALSVARQIQEMAEQMGWQLSKKGEAPI